MKKQAYVKKQILRKPLYFKIVGFEALLLCAGIIACGLCFCSAFLYISDFKLLCLAMIMGIAMIVGGVYLARFFLPNLMARITVLDDAITWGFLFRKIRINLADIRYTDITNYKRQAIVPYIVLATEPIGEVPLDKLKRSDKVIYFQLYEENIPALHEAIPKPYNQMLNKYLYMMNKKTK